MKMMAARTGAQRLQGPFGIEQALNAFHEISSGSGHRHLLRGPLLFQSLLCERGERDRISICVAPRCNHRVITAVFSLGTDYARDPPYSRMIEEQTFYEPLANVHQIIRAADMCQLMQKNGLYVVRWQMSEKSEWNKDHRA
jgi:hypothetical protein